MIRLALILMTLLPGVAAAERWFADPQKSRLEFMGLGQNVSNLFLFLCQMAQTSSILKTICTRKENDWRSTFSRHNILRVRGIITCQNTYKGFLDSPCLPKWELLSSERVKKSCVEPLRTFYTPVKTAFLQGIFRVIQAFCNLLINLFANTNDEIHA